MLLGAAGSDRDQNARSNVGCGAGSIAGRCRVPYSSASLLRPEGSEFTLVLLALPAVAGLVEPRLVLHPRHRDCHQPRPDPAGFEYLDAPLPEGLRSGPPDSKLAGDDAPVLIIGLYPGGGARSPMHSRSTI